MALKDFCLQVGVLRFTQDLKRLLQYLAVTAGEGLPLGAIARRM